MITKMKRMVWLGALAFSLLLTGCLRQPAGGEQTRLGMEALRQGDASGALDYFRNALSAAEEPVVLYRGTGIALMGLGRYEEAAEAFEKALDSTDDRMPKTVRDIRMYLTVTQYRMKAYDDVIENCRLLLEDERSAEVYYLLGASWLGKEDRDAARENFDQAAALSSGDYGMYLRIYECYEEHNLTAIGDEYLQTALGIPAETEQDRYEVGKIYFYLEQYEKAREVLMEPVEDGYMPALELMGEVYMKMDDYAHAKSVYQTVMDRNGDSPSAYNGLALCELASGNYDSAIQWIEQGLALEEEDGKQQLRFNEIVAYEKKLDFASALVKAEAYCELYPTDAEGRKELTFLRTR